MKKFAIVLLIFVMLFAVTACGGEEVGSGSEGGLTPFTTVDLEGNQVDDSVFSGSKLTMVNMWGTFCGPCLNEMPALGAIAADYDPSEFQIIGIVMDVPAYTDGTYDEDMIATAMELVDQTGASYLHILPSQSLADLKLNQVTAVPETVFVDSDGNYVGEPILGSMDEDSWREVISTYLDSME